MKGSRLLCTRMLLLLPHLLGEGQASLRLAKTKETTLLYTLAPYTVDCLLTLATISRPATTAAREGRSEPPACAPPWRRCVKCQSISHTVVSSSNLLTARSCADCACQPEAVPERLDWKASDC